MLNYQRVSQVSLNWWVVKSSHGFYAARLVKPEGKITDARTAITGIDAGAIHGDSSTQVYSTSSGWWSTVVRVEWMNLMMNGELMHKMDHS
jgi:hypothetical protein